MILNELRSIISISSNRMSIHQHILEIQMLKEINYSAPGSLILMGEHAILHGKKCLSAAISKRIKVKLIPKYDSQIITINSNLGNHSINLSELSKAEIKDFPINFNFVLTAIKLAKLSHGIELSITSDFPPTLGLGSSAAITICIIASLRKLQNKNMDLSKKEVLKEIFDESYKVVLKVQNRKGSGYDIMTSIFGGMIRYSTYCFFIKKIDIIDIPLSVYYSGYKTKTADVIELIEKEEKKYPSIYKKIYNIIDNLVYESMFFLKEKNWEQFGELMNINQGLLDAIGVNDKTLSDIIYSLRQKGVYGAKISGAGLGDCVIALGKNPNLSNYEKIDLNISSIGLRNE